MTATNDEEAAKDVSEKELTRSTKSTKVPGRFGIRHLQILQCFFGMIIGYSLRVSMSEAIVAMTTNSSNNIEVYKWNASEKSLVLSAFFWGYTVMQIPSGYLAKTWSAQKLLSFGMLLCGILNILIPTAAHYGSLIVVCTCRVFMGACQSCLLPCIHTLLSTWVPPSERSRLGSFAYAGAQFGTVICFPISGKLAGSAIGWPSVFYVFGALAILWSIIFFIFAFDSPSQHPRISEKEKEYIESSLMSNEDAETSSDDKQKLKTPWKAIFTSIPMYALIIVHCGQNWGYWTLITEMPSYMHDVLKFHIEENGLKAALPYLAMWILSFPMSWLSDYALEKGVSRGVTRKCCNTVAHWGPAVALICLAAMPVHNSNVVLLILIIAVGLNAGSLCGFQINHIDLSPKFAGTMMAITNCIASVVAIIAPLVCGAIVTEATSVAQWSVVFYLSASVYILGNLAFIIFGEAEVQPWNNPRTAETKMHAKKVFVAS